MKIQRFEDLECWKEAKQGRSATEVQSEAYVALDQKYIDQEPFEQIYNQAEKVSKLNSGLITYLLRNQRNYREKVSGTR